MGRKTLKCERGKTTPTILNMCTYVPMKHKTDEMKAILVIGYKTTNYGSVLQSVATVEVLKKLGCEVDVLNLTVLWGRYRRKKTWFYLRNFEIPFLVKSKGKLYLSFVERIINREYRLSMKHRRSLFDSFLNEHIHFTEIVHNDSEVSELSEQYNIAIIGSDQVWLPSSVVSGVYTLQEMSNEIRKISLASSFGIESIPPKYWESYRKMFEGMDWISVREETGKTIVESIAKKTCEVIADPVLMIKQDEWESIIERKTIIDEPYIFCYFIGSQRWHREVVRKCADKTHLKTVAIIHLDQYVGSDEKEYDYSYIDASPGFFVNLIRGAEIIITDSYHGSLFSIIEEKDFWCVTRHNEGERISTNGRMKSLFARLGLENRLLYMPGLPEGEDYMEHISYAPVTRAVEDMIASSRSFLDRIIRDEKDTESAGSK